VSTGSVLVIEGDEWVGTLLAKYLRERGYEAHVSTSAREGFARACETFPDCMIVNETLPDIDGLWVARRIRTETTDVSHTPIVFLAETLDKDARMQAFQVGVDVYLHKPYTHEEVAAQVRALLMLAERMSERVMKAASEEPPPSKRSLGVIISGDIARMSVPTVLVMLEMEKRTGELLIDHDFGGKAILYLRDGTFVGAKLDDTRKPALDIIRHTLAWKTGRFQFTVSDHTDVKLDAPCAVGATLLEATRLEDEKNHGSVSSAPPGIEGLHLESVRPPPLATPIITTTTPTSTSTSTPTPTSTSTSTPTSTSTKAAAASTASPLAPRIPVIPKPKT
jgi:CheY-like chemotaxis protein